MYNFNFITKLLLQSMSISELVSHGNILCVGTVATIAGALFCLNFLGCFVVLVCVMVARLSFNVNVKIITHILYWRGLRSGMHALGSNVLTEPSSKVLL